LKRSRDRFPGHGGRILSPAAGLRLPEAKTRTGTQGAAQAPTRRCVFHHGDTPDEDPAEEVENHPYPPTGSCTWPVREFYPTVTNQAFLQVRECGLREVDSSESGSDRFEGR